jgi:pimeloyl-ACP methyl ester carboxylesterase
LLGKFNLKEDLGRFDIPTLVLHSDDDQIMPIGASAMLSSKLIRTATLKVYEGAPHAEGSDQRRTARVSEVASSSSPIDATPSGATS